MGIAKYAQNKIFRCARFVGINDKYSLNARKHKNAKKINDTLWLIKIATVKINAITHHDLIRLFTSVKFLSGFHLVNKNAMMLEMINKAKIPNKTYVISCDNMSNATFIHLLQ